MASIPLTGQIRLGNDFNGQVYYGGSLTNQINMANNILTRDYSRGPIGYGFTATNYDTDEINPTPTAQHNLGQYRGGTGTYPTSSTTTNATGDSSQLVARENRIGSSAGDALFSGNIISGVDVGNNVVGQYNSGGAMNVVHEIGYLEPGNYKFTFSGGSYNEGSYYGIVRGYTGEHLTGSSSDYVFYSRVNTFSGGWRTGYLGTLGADFTVNATYPYVIISLECHGSSAYYLATSVNRKVSTEFRGDSNRLVVPHVWRVS